MLAAFLSFGYGEHEWLSDFAWQRQDLTGLIEDEPEE